jgi:hypothetical protein
MWHAYKLGKSMRGRRRASRLPPLIALTALVLIVLVALVVFYDLRRSNSSGPLDSKAQTQSVNGSLQTFYTGYFKFQDTGKWALNNQESTDSKFVFYRYHGAQLDNQLIVYINQVPTPPFLATTRVLPVRVVNNNSFDAANLSDPCVSAFRTGEPHRVKDVVINGTTMQCDPDSSLFTAMFAQEGGNYKISLKRMSGQSVQFVVTYRDYRAEPQTQTLLQVANSFQAL